ncbi:hypothetical protein Fmac_030400 [Flemingia macrophylla]|uniref:VQ domain-containing protein n=1 Tax=Flemingia macrophylla TaxID=520843 RepID=A0ABD1KZ41_9FABA
MSGPMPNDWLNFHQQTSSVSEATTVTVTTTAQLSPEGRVSKPIRRRSRASRRTPTTLLNTDTTNFRAMVQQFTGAPSAPQLFGPPAVPVNPNGGLMLAPSHHLYQQQHYTYAEGGENYFFERTTTAPNGGTGSQISSKDRHLAQRYNASMMSVITHYGRNFANSMEASE